jgi:hypothetical protein
MSSLSELTPLIQDIQHNCDISDARDHGIYTMCTMVLKLRNLYKWEKGLQPWEEPESADLLDWIDVKENYWATIAGEPFRPLLGPDSEGAVLVQKFVATGLAVLWSVQGRVTRPGAVYIVAGHHS